MTAPPDMEEGQSTTRPPHFNGKFYGWWKNHIYDYINAENIETWDVILDGTYIPSKDVIDGEINKVIPKIRKNIMNRTRKRQRRTINKKDFGTSNRLR